MKFIKVYQVNSLDIDGRLSGIVGHFSTHDLAAKAAKGHGSWGGMGQIALVPAMQLPTGQTWVLLQEDPVDLDMKSAKSDEMLREMVLARLTPEERRVLGLEE